MNNALATTEKPADQQQADRERAEQAKYLAANPGKALGSGAAISVLQNVYLSTLSKQFEWGKNLSRESAFALAVAAAQTSLNPLFGHIVVLGGSIYLTEKGCHHIANTNPQFDGYTLEPIPKSEYESLGFRAEEVAFKCEVYRKDRSRPTPGYGHASPANTSLPAVKTMWISEMSQKRAIQRAIIRAFDLPFVGADEPADSDLMNVTPPPGDQGAPEGSQGPETASSTGGTRAAQALAALRMSKVAPGGPAATTTVTTDQNLFAHVENPTEPPKQEELPEPVTDMLTVIEEIRGSASDEQMRHIIDGTALLGISAEGLREIVLGVELSGKLTKTSAKAVIAELEKRAS
jgi:hypothetical protein